MQTENCALCGGLRDVPSTSELCLLKIRMQCLFLKMFVTQMCSVAKVFSFIARGLMYLHGCVQVTVSRATGALCLGRLLTKA